MISKNKTEYHISLEDAKRQLRLDLDFTADDEYISRIIKSAVEIAEGEIQKDIALTTNVLTRYDFAAGIIQVNEGNLQSITSIEVSESEDPLSDFTTYVFRDYFKIELDSDIDTDELTLTFQTGYAKDNIPESVKQAILIKVADLYDIDRASSVMGSIKNTGIFELILAPFKAMYVSYEREN